MTALDQLQSKLTIKLGEIDAICAEHNYDVVPTLLLRHEDGPRKSILMGNDSLGKVVLCIAELGETGTRSDQSTYEAMLKLYMPDVHIQRISSEHGDV